MKPPTIHKNKRKVTPLVLDFNPNLPEVGSIINRNLRILHSSPLMREIFPARSIIPAFRRPKNLKEILAPSKLRQSESQIEHHGTQAPPAGCFKCRKTCDLCKKYFTESTSFTSYATGKTYQIKEHLTCNSSNVIYLASCNKCRLQYVGSSVKFKERFRNHKSHMLNNRHTCEVSKHYNHSTHQLSDFSFICIEGIRRTNNIDEALTNREAYWTAQLFTLTPYGLNKRQEYKSKNRKQYN